MHVSGTAAACSLLRNYASHRYQGAHHDLPTFPIGGDTHAATVSAGGAGKALVCLLPAGLLARSRAGSRPLQDYS